MTGTLRLAALVALLGLLTSPAAATTVRAKDVVCPVCQKQVRVLAVTSSNSFGGADYDLCSHARGDTPRSFGIWTCPACLWSRYGREFEKGPSPELARRVREELRSPVSFAPDAGQRDIPAWLKFRLAGTILEWEGEKAEALAQHYLAGAWATRCEGQRALRPLWKDEARSRRGDELSDAVLKTVQAEVTERPGELFFRCRFDLALADGHLAAASAGGVASGDAILHRLLGAFHRRYRGENEAAVTALDSLEGVKDLPDYARDAKNRLLESIDRERELQRAFVASFRASVQAGEGKPAEVAAGTYVLGETLRRLGRKDEAVKEIRRALEAEGGAAWLTPAATGALRRMGVPEPDAEELAKLQKRRVAGLIARLKDPETASDARRELEALRLPEALPGIVKALDSEHAEVRSQAALALGYQPEPDDAAIDRLGRVLLTDAEQDPRWRAAVSLARLAAERSRETLEKAIRQETDESVLRCVIEGLGYVGDERSIPALLKCFLVEDREVARAFSRIANREVSPDFNTREEFLAWWEENLPGKRADWVRAGFRAAGVEFEGPWDRAAIPKLLELLSHEHYWIRTNAARLLRRASGRGFPVAAIGDERDYPRAREERAAEIRVWKEWWASQK